MTQLKYKDNIFNVSAGSTVLDTLLENGHDIPNNCRAGACQSCVMQLTKGKVPEQAQKGLKDSHKAKGFFLACSCKPEEDIDIQLPDTEQLKVKATVTQLNKLSADVIELTIQTAEAVEYRTGQYVTLWRDDLLARSYSLASLPNDDKTLSFHIKHIPDGKFSSWVHHELQPGDELFVQGPAGDCFYTSGNPEQSLLLVGTGTGLAPLYGIVNDAIQQGHSGEIHLIHGALNPSGLYLMDDLSELELKYENIKYHPCVLNDEENMASKIIEEDISRVMSRVAPKPTGWKTFLCGDEEFVNKSRKQVFLAGCNMKDIYADPFIRT